MHILNLAIANELVRLKSIHKTLFQSDSSKLGSNEFVKLITQIVNLHYLYYPILDEN